MGSVRCLPTVCSQSQQHKFSQWHSQAWRAFSNCQQWEWLQQHPVSFFNFLIQPSNIYVEGCSRKCVFPPKIPNVGKHARWDVFSIQNFSAFGIIPVNCCLMSPRRLPNCIASLSRSWLELCQQEIPDQCTESCPVSCPWLLWGSRLLWDYVCKLWLWWYDQ